MATLTEELRVKLNANTTDYISGMKKASTITKGLKTSLKSLAIAAAVVGVAATKMAMTFESRMTQVWTLVDISKRRFQALSMSVLNLSRKVGESTATLTKGLYDIVSAGVSVRNSISFLKVATQAAVAGATNTAIAVDALTSVVNAYGDALGKNLSVVERAKRVNDILFLTVKYGKTTFQELATSIGTLTAVSAQVGVSLREVGAGLATLTKGGIQTQIAIVYLRQVLMAVIKPSEQARQLAEKLGIDFSIASMRARGLAGFLNYVKQATQGNAQALATLFPNVRALAGVMALTGKQAKEYNSILQKMRTEHGAAKEAFQKMSQTSLMSMKKLIQGAKALAISFGMGLTKGIKEVSDATRSLSKDTISLNLLQKAGTLIVKTLAYSFYVFKANILITTSVLARFYNYLKIAVKKTLLFLIKTAKLVRVNLSSLEAYARGINTTSIALALYTQAIKANANASAIWNKKVKRETKSLTKFDVLAHAKAQKKKETAHRETLRKRIVAERSTRIKQREIVFKQYMREKNYVKSLTSYIERNLNNRVKKYRSSIAQQKELIKSLHSEYLNILKAQRQQQESFVAMRVALVSKALTPQGKAIQQRGLAKFYTYRAEEAKRRGRFEEARSLLKQAQQVYYQLAMQAKQPTLTQDYVRFLELQKKIQVTFEEQKKQNTVSLNKAEIRIKELRKKIKDFFSLVDQRVTIKLSTKEASEKLNALSKKIAEAKAKFVSAGVIGGKKEREVTPPSINLVFNIKEKVDKKIIRTVIIPEIEKTISRRVNASARK